MKKIFFLFIFFCQGCGYLAHWDQLMTLQTYSQSGDQKEKAVERQNKKFDHLLKAVREGDLKDFSNQKKILREFGDPILIKKINIENQDLEQWLYRYATVYFNTDKVYLFFDGKGDLVNWEYLPAKPQEFPQQAAS